MKNLIKVYDFVALICFIAMMICVLFEVVSRNIINLPITWAEELSRILFVWAVFIGAAPAAHRGKHILIDALTRKLSGKAKEIVCLVSSCLTCGFILIVWYGTLRIILSDYMITTEALEISVAILYLALLFGSFGIIISELVFIRETGTRIRELMGKR